MSTSGNKNKEKVEKILADSKLAFLDSPKYIEPSEVSRIGKRKLKKMKKEEKEKTKGPGWYNMGAPELTNERKNDLEALRHRGALETKRFYKRNNITTQPKYFQVGRIVETPADYYSSRIPKKQRKQTLAEEFVAEIE